MNCINYYQQEKMVSQMPNPFFQSLQPNQKMNYTPYRDAYKMFSQSKNPMELLMKMAQQNPNLQPVVSMIQAGKNPQMVFNQLCQQRGINPQEFIKNITG